MVHFNSVILADANSLVSSLEKILVNFCGTTVLITGASGFIGSYLLDVLATFNKSGIGKPCRIIGVDNFQSGLPDRIAHLYGRDDIKLLQHDLTVPLSDGELKSVDWIIHGASIASPVLYRKHPLQTIDVNVGGTRQMLDLCRQGVRSMLYLSSSEIYGNPDPAHVPTAEDYLGAVSCTGPRACYDESKRLAETLCTTYFRLFACPVKIVRPFNVYGPGQRIDDGRIIPDLMSAALKKESLCLFSDGTATRSFCYISDAIAAIINVLLSSANGEAFNIGNDCEVSITAVAEIMQKIAAPPILPIRHQKSADQDYLKDSPQRRCPNLNKLRSLAPWSPKVDLEDGLTRTLRSYQETLLPQLAY